MLCYRQNEKANCSHISFNQLVIVAPLKHNFVFDVDNDFIDGEFLNGSTTHTNIEQGAWWQVDLGSKKNINEIIIYNRIDCCANRLSNYQVSISDKANFSTHTYQQDFHVAPNPKTSIKLDALGKQGRYVRIQLLDKNYLSLSEVQVIGVDL